MSDSYNLGDTIRVAVEWETKVTGLPYDPPKSEVRIKEPDGTVTTKTYPTDADVIQDSSGNYYYDHISMQRGVHIYVWRALNGSNVAIAATDDIRFNVKASQFSL